jgi:hypothetical protein
MLFERYKAKIFETATRKIIENIIDDSYNK